MFPHEIALSKFPLTGIAIEHIERGPVKYRLGVARVSACQRVARVLSPPLEGLKEFVDCTRVICASTSTKWLSWRLFRPRVFLRLSVRRRPFSPSWIWRGGGGGGGGGERRGFPSEGAVSLTGRPRGGFAIRGATRSFAVLEGSRERFEKSRLRRLSNNWSDRGKGDVRSPARKFEFRFRMDRLSRRYLNVFKRWLCTLFERCWMFLHLARVNEESGSFLGGSWRGLFRRTRLLCALYRHSMMILSLKFKWTEST